MKSTTPEAAYRRRIAIPIINQWRVCFVWTGSDATNVEIVDYHCDLNFALKQLTDYALKLDSPPLLVVSDRAHYQPEMPDDDILRRLLALNLACTLSKI